MIDQFARDFTSDPAWHLISDGAAFEFFYTDQRGSFMRNAPSTKGGASVPRRSEVAGLFVVPKLEEVAAGDGVTEALDARTTDLLETTAIVALSALRKRKLTLAAEAGLASQARRPDRLLKAKEVAERLGMGIDWVYHNQHKLPFRVPLGTVPRFSENGLDEFIRKRQGT